MKLSDLFQEAVTDYLYLIERNYSQKQVLKLVGDKYQLTGEERSVLFRGVVRSADCISRKKKQLSKVPDGSTLIIDGYNVIRTIGTYLLGRLLFVSMDGFLRDASEMHRSTLKSSILDKCLDLLFDFFVKHDPREVKIYLDEPVSKSGELASGMNKLLKKYGLHGEALTVPSPDYELKQVNSGIVCTADSAIIDNCKVPVFDLAYAILKDIYSPEFISLEKQG